MKLHIVSDLHLKLQQLEPLPVVGDVLVLAGDIAEGLDMRGCRNFEKVISLYRKEGKLCLWVLGNHEWEMLIYPDNLNTIQQFASEMGVHLLLDSYIDIGEYRIFGGTLWTNFEILGDVEKSMAVARQQMGDYMTMYCRDPDTGKIRMLDPKDTRDRHNECVQAMYKAFQEKAPGGRIVITHHAPHQNSIHPRFEGSPLNACFASDLTKVIHDIQPEIWVHGHNHTSFDYIVGNTRVLCNPVGYVFQKNKDFDQELVVETLL